MQDRYDVVVIGSGLGGLTAANRLARNGHRVLLCEQHFQFGGLATYFRRRQHVFDVALHGFPIGMKKSFRKYWGPEFAERIVQVKHIRFDNPQFQLETTFDTADFTRHLTETFGVPTSAVDAFFECVQKMNYYDDRSETTRELFQRFFPDRHDVWRLLMEPITYANGSTLDEPAITYGIVFGNFMSKGVYTFRGGTDLLLDMMLHELRANGVDCLPRTHVDRVLVEDGRVCGVRIDGRTVACEAVVSNASLLRTVHELVGDEHFDTAFLEGFSNVRPSNSSCQVYIGIRPGEAVPPIGDLLFSSTHPEFDAGAVCNRRITSRTFSVYYPWIRPGHEDYTVVASMNAWARDWEGLTPDQYRQEKQNLVEDALEALERYVPGVRDRIDYTEAATPRTFARYTGHVGGASFGTKFEGLEFSSGLSTQLPGLFHTGSVGIIMSGWLGAANYGIITANEVEKHLAR
jgi:phytoene dehydrogenase-like protein